MESQFELWPLLVAESILLILVFVALPAFAAWRSARGSEIPLKGLALPQGSIRSMLALSVVGSFVVFLIFGSGMDTGNFTQIVTALTGVAGTVMGFYFGSGGSAGASEPAAPSQNRDSRIRAPKGVENSKEDDLSHESAGAAQVSRQ